MSQLVAVLADVDGRSYKGMNIQRATGLTNAQKSTLKALGVWV
ncbi:hypothetical protein [Microcoleus sp. POL10_C6]